MNTDELNAIRARVASITPGEWAEYTESNGWFGIIWQNGNDPRNSGVVGYDFLEERDAVFIAHAPADIRALLDYVAQLEAVAHGLMDVIDRASVSSPQSRYKSCFACGGDIAERNGQLWQDIQGHRDDCAWWKAQQLAGDKKQER